MRTGDQKEALRLLEGAVRASPEKPIIRFHFAQVLSESGDREAAISELKTLLATTHDFPERDKAKDLLYALTN
jgi:thioredoxin-like negative regulator of GroEL